MGRVTAPVSDARRIDPSAFSVASARAGNGPWHDGLGDAAGATWQPGRSFSPYRQYIKVGWVSLIP